MFQRSGAVKLNYYKSKFLQKITFNEKYFEKNFRYKMETCCSKISYIWSESFCME